MKKVVWTFALICLAMADVAVGDAAAQTRPQALRQQVRNRIERRVQQQFKRLDQNGNGAIDKTEWKRNERVFTRFDANHDGVLSPQELRRAMRRAAVRRRR